MVSRRKFVAGAVATPFLASSSLASAAQEDEQVTLRLSFDADYAEAMIEPFVQNNPNIAIEQSSGGLSFEDGSMQTTIQSGEGPDVLSALSGPGRIGVLAVNGLILPLDDFYQRAGLLDLYPAGVLEPLRAQHPEGEIHEVPIGFDVFPVYYWKDTFEENELEPPQSWDEFLAICQTLEDAGVQPISLGARDNFMTGWLLGNLIQASAGREVMTEIIYGDGDFTHPGILRAAEMLKQLVDEGYINGLEAASLTFEQAVAAFGQGRSGMAVMSQAPLLGIGRDGVDLNNIGSFLLPSLNEGQPPAPTANLSTSWIINANTQRVEAAEAWLEWAVSDEALRIEIDSGGSFVPARNVPDEITLPPALKEASDRLANVVGYNPSAYLPAAPKDAYYAALQQIVTGQASAQEAVQLVQDALEESRVEG